MNLTEIPTAALLSNASNVRRHLGDLTELAESIAGIGILQPLTVAPAHDFFDSHKYVVIAGHRRLAAAGIAGLETVPCVVRPDLTLERDQLQAMLVENLQRTDLTVMEEATAYEQLELMGVTAERIAKTTGRARSTVESRMKLMTLPEQARGRIDSGQLTLKDAEYFAQFADDAEIMAVVDGREYGTKWAVEMILTQRKAAADSAAYAAAHADDDEDDTPRISDMEKNAAFRAEQDRKRTERNAIIETSNRIRATWVLEQIETGSTDFLDKLVRLAIEQGLREYDTDAALEAIGIDPPGEDEDADDANLRIDKAVDALSKQRQITLLALLTADVLSTSMYGVEGHITDMRDWLGYEPADAELQLLGEGS